MLGIRKKVPVQVLPTLQSEANPSYNPYGNTTSQTITDLDSLKALLLSDPSAIALLKGADGTNGRDGTIGTNGEDGLKGEPGTSVIIRSDDPIVGLSSQIGDLLLNTTSGSLFQRSGLTQTQFINAGLQGLILSDSIWILKGNLKGANGAKGDKGDAGQSILSGVGNPFEIIADLPPVGALYINKNTFAVYERSPTEFIPGQIQGGIEDYSVGYWQLIGTLKGANGKDGQNGKSFIHSDDIQEIKNIQEGYIFSSTIRNGNLELFRRTAFNGVTPNTQLYYEFLHSMKGENGNDGSKIIVATGHPYDYDQIEELQPLPFGTLYFRQDTSMLYQRIEPFISLPLNNQPVEIDYSNGYYHLIGSLKGATGANGEDLINVFKTTSQDNENIDLLYGEKLLIKNDTVMVRVYPNSQGIYHNEIMTTNIGNGRLNLGVSDLYINGTITTKSVGNSLYGMSMNNTVKVIGHVSYVTVLVL